MITKRLRWRHGVLLTVLGDDDLLAIIEGGHVTVYDRTPAHVYVIQASIHTTPDLALAMARMHLHNRLLGTLTWGRAE